MLNRSEDTDGTFLAKQLQTLDEMSICWMEAALGAGDARPIRGATIRR